MNTHPCITDSLINFLKQPILTSEPTRRYCAGKSKTVALELLIVKYLAMEESDGDRAPTKNDSEAPAKKPKEALLETIIGIVNGLFKEYNKSKADLDKCRSKSDLGHETKEADIERFDQVKWVEYFALAALECYPKFKTSGESTIYSEAPPKSELS
jgi:hypothetical protein